MIFTCTAWSQGLGFIDHTLVLSIFSPCNFVLVVNIPLHPSNLGTEWPQPWENLPNKTFPIGWNYFQKENTFQQCWCELSRRKRSPKSVTAVVPTNCRGSFFCRKLYERGGFNLAPLPMAGRQVQSKWCAEKRTRWVGGGMGDVFVVTTMW